MLDLSVKAKALLDETNVEQQLILEIDGIPFLYGAVDVTTPLKYGDDVEYGDDIVYGGIKVDPNSRPYISLQGTTRNLTSQLEIYKGGTGSVQKFNVTLIDKDQQVTQAFQPGNFVSDILSQKADIYIGFQGSAHPEDSIKIFSGIITSTQAAAGAWRIGIDHPDYLKRADLFPQIITPLDGSISDIDTTIDVVSTSGLIKPQDAIRSFVQIDDEIIEYDDFNATQLTGCTRGSLGTVAASHSDEADVTSYYRLEGNPIDLALKLMLSDPDNSPFISGLSVPNFVTISGSESYENGLLFTDTQLRQELGLELGDLVSVSGASNPANNFSDAIITNFVDSTLGTVVVVSGPTLVPEVGSSAVASFKSQHNLLSEGAGMSPDQVDVAQHELMKQLVPGIPDISPDLKDTINLKDFVTLELYFPSGFYQCPRKAKSSVNGVFPPLVLEELPVLDETNTTRVDKNNVKRSLNVNYYNTVAYRFNQDTLTDRFLAGEIQVSQRSFNRFNVGTKTLSVDATGFRDTAETRNFIRAQARRFADRYQFAAESITVQTDYKTGLPIEITDVVLYGSSALQLPDINTGNRDFQPRLMIVSNKKLDIRGKVTLELLDTGFGLDGRYGTVAPSSKIDSGATTTSIPLKRSTSVESNELERDKYSAFLGETMRVHNDDFTFDETVTLVQFDPANANRVDVLPALSVAPSEDFVFELAEYPDTTNTEDNENQKQIHCFFDPQVNVVSGLSTTEFTVSASDIDKFFVDAFVVVHNADWSTSSTEDSLDDDIQVVAVDTGTNTVTVGDMGFTPDSTFLVDLIGFKDEGLPYRVF